MCFPTFEGVYVNPSSRLALRGSCTEECELGTESYHWSVGMGENGEYPMVEVSHVSDVNATTLGRHCDIATVPNLQLFLF